MKPNWNNVNWVQERVNQGHHQALTKYLMHRTSGQKALADAAGLTTAEIMSQAFLVKNGHTTVPQCAIKLLRHPLVVGVDLSFVISLCRLSRDSDLHIRELAKVLKKWFDPASLGEDAKAVINEAAVRDVMEG